jgi:pyridoxamine 5'-phosphate oxidase
MNIAELRREYASAGLREEDVAPDPFLQFDRWLHQAVEAGVPEPNAMTLATVGAGGAPAARMVLLKAADARGFAFFTNLESRKVRELLQNPAAALVFFWAELERQVRVEGRVVGVPREEAERYFSSRPRGSRLGAWASRQSTLVPSRTELEERLRALEEEYRGRDVPTPPFWGGFRVVPETVEFWQGRENRLHDRLLYVLQGGAWLIRRLQP